MDVPYRLYVIEQHMNASIANVGSTCVFVGVGGDVGIHVNVNVNVDVSKG